MHSSRELTRVIHKGEAGEDHLPSTMSLGWVKGQHILSQKMADPDQACTSQKRDLEVHLPSSSQLLGHKPTELLLSSQCEHLCGQQQNDCKQHRN